MRITTAAPRLRALVAALPWALWYGALALRDGAVRGAKDASLYDGWCVRSTGLRVRCSLDQWMSWEPSPGLRGALVLVGALVAAAASAALWLTLRRGEDRAGRPARAG